MIEKQWVRFVSVGMGLALLVLAACGPETQATETTSTQANGSDLKSVV